MAAIALHAPLFTPRLAAQSDAVIQTVAGSRGVGDGGAAAAASLRFPSGVAVDGAGNLYIADTYAHRIRKVDASGAISTVAGTGAGGYSGDGAAAAAAQLSFPSGVAVDSSNNLYIADQQNDRIRKVDASTGAISTVAGDGTRGYGGDGGPAAAAQFDGPSGVAVDSAGNIYIADTFNQRIRRVDASGNVSTVAGTGIRSIDPAGRLATATHLSDPNDVAVDGRGNLYIAVTLSFLVYKVDASTGIISTVAGTGTSGYNGDGGAGTAARISRPRGVAVDRAGNIYIADANNHRIRKVDASGAISTVVGDGTGGYSGDGGAATAAQLFLPYGVAADSAGNLYVADRGNHRIRKVDASGAISTVAGTSNIGDGEAAPAAQLALPQEVTADSAGNLYVADTWNNRIRKVDASTGIISTVAGDGTYGYSGDGGAASSAQLALPRDVAADSAGNLYVADTRNNRIRKVDASTGVISTVAGSGTYGYSGDGGPAVSANLRFPYGLDVDGSGNIYFVDRYSFRIRKVDTAGVITTVAGGGTTVGGGGAATAARLFEIQDVAVDSAGNFYIAANASHSIRKVDASTGVISTVAGSYSLVGFSGDGGAAASARLNQPYSVAVDSSNNLYIADRNNNRIRKVDASTGNISTVAGSGQSGHNGDECAATAARLRQPSGVAVDGAGNLYVADRLNNRIRKVSPQPPGSDPLGPCRITIFEPKLVPVSEPPQQPGAPGPSVEPVGVSELSFAPAPNADPGEPMSQTLTLRAEGGATDFQALPSARWIQVSRAEGSAAQWRGRLADGETITLLVTVNPLGLRPGTHRGRLYIRAGGRLTARVNIVLEVPPPTGPDVSESGGVFDAARASAYGEAGLFGPQLLPVSPGSLVVVQGVNFASGEPVMAEGFPLPTSLGGARVLFDGAAVPLFSVGPRRIEAQLPWELGGEETAAGGLALASVVVESGGESSWPRRFWVGPYAPGVFTASGTGQGQALALFAGTTDLAAPLGFSAGSRPARAGDVLEIYATGLGAVEPPLVDGMNSCAPDGVCLEDGSNAVLRHTAARPRVWIGVWPLPAENVRFSGLAPDMAGVNLVVVEVPRNLTPSNAAELRLAVASRISQSDATIAVE